MPVKVRCSGCKKVLNAPDKARGKTLKCPQCKTPIPIPSEKSEPDSTQDSSEFLANLDLRAAEDRSQRLCPRCGTAADEEETHCSNCGADLATGIVPKKKKRKGPDTSEFFKTVWSDAWQFTLKNNSFILRTTLYNLFLLSLCVGSLWMALWSSNTPPQAFWWFVTFVFAMAPIGWVWFLVTETIKFSLKKEDQLKRVHFNFFTCVSLGIKFFVWGVALGLPILLVFGGMGGAMIRGGSLIPGAILIGFGVLLTYSMLPIAMCHMAMPQQLPGWQIQKVLPGWWKSIGGVSYALLICFIVSLPITVPLVTLGAVYANDLNKIASDLQENGRIDKAVQQKEELPQEDVTPEIEELAGRTPVEVNYRPLIVPGVLLGVAILLSGFPTVYASRVIGQFAFYFKRRMDLDTLEKQLVYKSKTAGPGEEEAAVRKINRRGLSTVATGLNLLLTAILIQVFLMLVSIVLRFVETPETIETILGWVSLASGGIYLIGIVLCFWTPPEARARGFLILAFASPFISIILAVIVLVGLVDVLQLLELALVAIVVVGGIVLSAVLAFIFFLMYLKRLSEYVRFREGSMLADQIMVLYVAYIALAIVTVLLIALLGFIGLMIGGVIGLIMIGIEINLIIKLISLLASLKEQCHR